MSRELLVRLGTMVWLAIVYTALWGNLSVANLVAGLAVGALIMLALPLPRVPIHGRVHPLTLVQLVAVSAYYAIESSLQIAWYAVRPTGSPVSGVLRVRLSIRSDLVLVLCADLLNIIPGTMVLEIDREHHTVYVHVLDVGSDAAIDKFYRSTRQLEGLLIRAFERPGEWHENSPAPTELGGDGRRPRRKGEDQ